MGDVAELVMDGVLCEVCGSLVEVGLVVNFNGPGHPRKCALCSDEDDGAQEASDG